MNFDYLIMGLFIFGCAFSFAAYADTPQKKTYKSMSMIMWIALFIAIAITSHS